MINFYKMYNKKGLDKEEYSPLIEQSIYGRYTKEMKLIEHIIKKSPRNACWYSLKVIKDRWIEGEPIIMKDPYYAYQYALHILKGRWIEAECIIMKDARYTYQYARDIMKSRWIEAEPYIKKYEYWWAEYREYFII